MRLIPPIALPLSLPEILSSVGGAGAVSLESALRQRFGASSVCCFTSGRAALSHQLERWKGEGRDQVVVPAYTCWSVAASIVRAGLKVRVADVDPQTLDYDGASLEAALSESAVAVLGTHLFARTAKIEPLVRLARPLAVRVVDDAAQALPTEAEGADVTLFSFGRGKPIALGGGGALLLHRGHQADDTPAASGWGAAAKFAATSLLGRPSLYRLPRSLPFLAIGQTEYDPQFNRIGTLFEWQRRLAKLQFERYDAVANRRSAHAKELIDVVERFERWTIPALESMRVAPLRLPLLAPDSGQREQLCERLASRGVSAVPMYPTALPRIPALQPHLISAAACPGGDELASRLVTLPTYPTLTRSDRRRLVQALEKTLGEID